MKRRMYKVQEQSTFTVITFLCPLGQVISWWSDGEQGSDRDPAGTDPQHLGR